jgi:hypothetical protein
VKPAPGVLADGKLGFENVKSVLGKSQQVADLMVGALRQLFVEEGAVPESAEPLGKMGKAYKYRS